MSNELDVVNTISTMVFALCSVLSTSACDDFEDPTQPATFADADEAEGLQPAALDWDDDPQPQAAPNGFYIEQVESKGKGCPDPGSVAFQLFAKNTLLRVIYGEMILPQPEGLAVQTTSCTTTLKLHIPKGWKVAPATLISRGYAYLDDEIKARRHSNLFFAGDPFGVEFETEFKGPDSGIYQAIDIVPPGVGWSSCGGSALFSISNSLVLNATANPEGSAFIALVDDRLVSWHFQLC